MASPKVTVVTPSFNQGEFIEETILSVLNQTYENIEYIIVDGGSTDSTNDILRKYRGRFTLIQGKDKGQADAINIGLRRATGELVGWLNSDDLLERDGIARIVEGYRQNPTASIYYGFIKMIDRNGDFLCLPRYGRLTIKNIFLGRPCLLQPGSFYPAELVRKVGYLDVNLRMAMDLDLFLKLLKLGEAQFIPHFVARMRVHSEAKTSKYRGVAFREDIYVRLRHGIPKFWLLLFIIRRVLLLAKSWLEDKEVLEKY